MGKGDRLDLMPYNGGIDMGIRAISLSSAAAALAALPLTVFAATSDFFGPIVPQSGACHCDTAMDWGCVVLVLHNVLNVLVSVSVIAVVFFIALAGFSLMTSGANPAARTKARNRMLNAIVGLVLVLGAFLVVDTVMKVLYNPATAFDSGTFGPWNEILAGNGTNYCLKLNLNPGQLTDGVEGSLLGTATNLGTGNSSSSGTYGGSCNVANAGACSVSSLAATCFGNRAQEASRICNLESAGGNPAIPSGSDRLNGGSGPSYSWGLWQINLTTSKVGGLNCPAAFSKPCQSPNLVGPSKPGACNSTIINPDLYNQCVAAAKIPANNSAVACTLYRQAGGFRPWTYTANRCNVPLRS